MAQITIEKLVFGGQGLGRLNGKVAFVWNALPGETVEVEIIQNKKTHLEAVATKILVSSPGRIPPHDDHFLSCSPWQIMTIEQELEWKKTLAKETYEKIGGFSPDTIDIASPDATLGYRNKMEYSFAQTQSGISLAFFDRGGKHRSPIPHCALARPSMENATTRLLQWIRDEAIPLRTLKTLIIRTNTAGDILAGLFLKDRLAFQNPPALAAGITGLNIFYSTHKSPASVPTDVLMTLGKPSLTETVRGKKFSYGLFSFFQIHIPIFETALHDIAVHLRGDLPVLDYYSGVGAVGIALSDRAPSGLLVESNAEAVDYAQLNIAQNNLQSLYTVQHAPAEKITERIIQESTLIIDPPRAGLHERVVRAILEKRPRQIVYLSCNLATHARDLALLSGAYRVSFLKIYNFFPRTPHIEGLCVLDTH